MGLVDRTMAAARGGPARGIRDASYFGPDVDQRRWRFVTPGSLIALVVWLLASGGFALYTNYFGSYNKTWGSLSAVIVTLTWLWLTALRFSSAAN